MNESDVSEGSEVGDTPECQYIDRSETLTESKCENSEYNLQEAPSLNENRITTEKCEIGVVDINSNRNSLNASSGCNTNRSKQSKRNKKRSYRI